MKASVRGFTMLVRLKRYLGGAEMVSWIENEFPSSRIDPALPTMADLNDLQRLAKSLTCLAAVQTVHADATHASAVV